MSVMKEFVNALQNEKFYSVTLPQFQFKIDKVSKKIFPNNLDKTINTRCLTKRYLKASESKTRLFGYGITGSYADANNAISDQLWERQINISGAKTVDE